MTRNIVTEKRQDWGSPQALFDRWNKEYDFTVDACATEENKKLERFWSEKEDGLKQSWVSEHPFCNPPYKDTARWLAKREADDATAVFLLPANTDTNWFHTYIVGKAVSVFFFKQRIKFVGPSGNGPGFPSMLVEFHKGVSPDKTYFGSRCSKTGRILSDSQ